MDAGTIVALHRTPARRAGLIGLAAVEVKEDWGVEGDRHARPGSSRQVVMATSEVLERLGLEPGDVREQITIRGLPALAIGNVLEIGAVRLEVTGPRVPCGRMDDVRPGLKQELRGQAGWCLRVRSGGPIAVGDRVGIAQLDDASFVADFRRALGEWEESGPEPAHEGWTFHHQLAHLIAWNQHALAQIARLVEGGDDEEYSPATAEERSHAAAAELVEPDGTATVDLWSALDSTSTALVDLARIQPAHAQDWVERLTAHVREHAALGG